MTTFTYKQLSTFGNSSDAVFSIIVDKSAMGGSQKITFKLSWGVHINLLFSVAVVYVD